MRKLHQSYAKQGFEILGIAGMDTKESLQACFKEHGALSWPNILDPDYKLVDGYDIQAFPTYVLLDKNGKHITFNNSLNGMEAAVKKALGLPEKKRKSFVPFKNFAEPIDDVRIIEELVSGRDRLVAKDPKAWSKFDIRKAPKTCDLPAPIADKAKKPSLEEITHATGIIVGGRDEGSTWTAGGVFVSADGLFVTNHHVASGRKEPIAVMTTDGKLHRATTVVAAEKKGDVALLQVEGSGFPFAQLAPRAPRSGEDVTLIHHSEERYYTYDRGYVRRHSFMGGATYMEISAEYAIGGSGCGIFNRDHQLVGLVSSISYGSGPELTDAIETRIEESSDDEEFADYVIIVRQASSWKSLRSLWE